MPKKPIDFSKTIIYKIWKDDDFYIGSTTDFASRKRNHKQICTNEKYSHHNYKIYQIIREKGGWDEWQMTPLEEYTECQSQTQARIKEEEWRVKLQANLNSRKSFGAETKEEYNAQYRQEHADEIKIRMAKYRQENADKIKVQRSQYRQEHADEIKIQKNKYRQENADKIKAKITQPYQCSCGSIVQNCVKARHERTLKHQEWLKSQK